jgi:hypothetical protein
MRDDCTPHLLVLLKRLALPISVWIATLQFFPRQQQAIFDFGTDFFADGSLNFYQVNQKAVELVVALELLSTGIDSYCKQRFNLCKGKPQRTLLRKSYFELRVFC